MATLVALVPFAAVIADCSKLLTLPTLRAAEALRPAGKLQGREALFLSSIGLYEIGKGKPLLVLAFVLGHAMVLQQRAGWWGLWGLAELCC
jgi:hypothetical protein